MAGEIEKDVNRNSASFSEITHQKKTLEAGRPKSDNCSKLNVVGSSYDDVSGRSIAVFLHEGCDTSQENDEHFDTFSVKQANYDTNPGFDSDLPYTDFECKMSSSENAGRCSTGKSLVFPRSSCIFVADTALHFRSSVPF